MKTTMNEVKRRNAVCIEVGFSNLYHTLHECADHRDGHTEGVYGWNADIYEFGNFAIVTGYRPFGKDILSWKFCKRWEGKAKAHYNKVFAKLPSGNYRSSEMRERMRYTFRCQFEKSVNAEIEKWRNAKGKKGTRAAA